MAQQESQTIFQPFLLIMHRRLATTDSRCCLSSKKRHRHGRQSEIEGDELKIIVHYKLEWFRAKQSRIHVKHYIPNQEL